MNELLITIMLVIPAPDKHVDWSINEIPTQIQLIHEGGIEVSYNAMSVPCGHKARTRWEMVFKSSQAHEQDRCYSVYDLTSPSFIRHPNYWYPIELPKPHDPR